MTTVLRYNVFFIGLPSKEQHHYTLYENQMNHEQFAMWAVGMGEAYLQTQIFVSADVMHVDEAESRE